MAHIRDRNPTLPFAPEEMQSRGSSVLTVQHVLPALPYNTGKSSPGFGLHRVLWEVSSCSPPDNHNPTERIWMAISGVPEQRCSVTRRFHHLQSQEYAGFPAGLGTSTGCLQHCNVLSAAPAHTAELQ